MTGQIRIRNWLLILRAHNTYLLLESVAVKLFFELNESQKVTHGRKHALANVISGIVGRVSSASNFPSYIINTLEMFRPLGAQHRHLLSRARRRRRSLPGRPLSPARKFQWV